MGSASDLTSDAKTRQRMFDTMTAGLLEPVVLCTYTRRTRSTLASAAVWPPRCEHGATLPVGCHPALCGVTDPVVAARAWIVCSSPTAPLPGEEVVVTIVQVVNAVTGQPGTLQVTNYRLRFFPFVKPPHVLRTCQRVMVSCHVVRSGVRC